MCQEDPVLLGSNLEMVDRGLLDSVPNVQETLNLKHGLHYILNVPQEPSVLLGSMSNLEKVDRGLLDSVPYVLHTWRWWIGHTLPLECVS